MRGTNIVGKDSAIDETAIEVPGSDGGTWLINVSDEPMILREPDLQECREHLAAFRKLQLPWIADTLCEPNKAGTHVFGISGNLIPTNGQPCEDSPLHWNPRVIALEDVSPSLWQIFNGHHEKYEARNMLLSRAPLEEQRQFVREYIQGDPQRIASRLKNQNKDRFVYPGLEIALEDSQSGTDFVKALIEMVSEQADIKTTRDEGKRIVNADTKTPIPLLFALYLCGKGILLLPVGLAVVPGRADGIAFPLARKIMADRFGEFEREVVAKINDKHDLTYAQRVERIFHALAGATTFSRLGDVSPEGFAAVRDLLQDKGLGNVPEPHLFISKIFSILRSADQKSMPKRKKRLEPIHCKVCGDTIPVEYAWTIRMDAAPKALPNGTPAEYHAGMSFPGQSVGHFAHVLDGLLKRKGNTRLGPLISLLQKFISWVAWRHTRGELVDTSIDCLPTRKEINDGNDDDLSGSTCLRAWLRRTHGVDATNRTLALLEDMFKILIKTATEKYPDITKAAKNPVILDYDQFVREDPINSKSVRPAMSRTVLKALLDANRKDDYGLSKNNPEHKRQGYDPESGTYQEMWFPGPAYLLELLLLLPLRSFQARFLDSGEIDETRHRLSPEAIVTFKNPKGIPKRSEGVLHPFENLGGERVFGLHVNTNKTGAKRNGSYLIPWSSPEIVSLLETMIRWQETHNPNAKAVPCQEKHENEKSKTRNAGIENRLKTTLPLFRDPADHDGWPITRSCLERHWEAVNKAAEAELRKAGHNVTLVETKTGQNRRKKIAATHDIHGLRVSGITALIENGVSPEIVQEVAGHSTLAMTLYYLKKRAGDMEKTLSEAMRKCWDTVGDAQTNESDFQEIRSQLFNQSDSEFPKEMLDHQRRLGTGSVLTFTHGICPGGTCDTGGMDGAPLPRAEACSLCRYRLTGPAFLSGLVLNSNVLIHDMRRIGLDIANLQRQIRDLDDQGRQSGPLRAKVESLYRQSEATAKEWAAEVQYVMAARKWFDSTEDGAKPPVIFGSEPPECRLEQVSHFDLLQKLAEGGQQLPGACPSVALTEHREYLNELLEASDMEPLLLKLKGDQRDRAAVLLGRALTSLVPVEKQEAIREQKSTLVDFPSFGRFLDAVRHGAEIGALDMTGFAALLPEKTTGGRDI